MALETGSWLMKKRIAQWGEADAFYKLVCFDAPYREKMAGALRQAGLPE